MDVIELFSKCFEYRDGNLYWRKTFGSRALKGNRAGKLRKDGYRDVALYGKLYLEHRIIFALHYNYLPVVVDHIDHNPSNNKIENLRNSDYNRNIWNSRKSVRNTTNVKGIRLTRNGKFEARVAAFGRTYQVGTYLTLNDAEKALIAFRTELHKEHSCNG